ncbi:MAG: glycosyltransferase family 2 protein, partial [Cyclobacteriaceae bacterium]
MKSNPSVHVYAVCKNEMDFIPHFFKYYERIADRIVIYDNQSIDGSREYIQNHEKGELRNYNTSGELRDDIHMWIKNSVWKESRGIADWVIVSDLDEVVYHRRLKRFLLIQQKKGVTICKGVGFNMYSDSYPSADGALIDQVNLGAYSIQFSKMVLFNPNEIAELNSTPGGHNAYPEGNVKLSTFDGLYLLHFKYLGGLDRLLKRWSIVGNELSAINLKFRWGIQRRDADEIAKRYAFVKSNAVKVIRK